MKIIETDWSWKTALSKRTRTDYIVLHHAEASECTAEQIDSWHKGNGWSGIGYHFFVRKDGSVYRGRPLDSMGAHVQGMNSCSVGICAEGAYSREYMPDIQKRAIAELIDYLKTNYYPDSIVVGHREVGSSDCPGKNYPLEELKRYSEILNNGSEGLTMTQYEELKAEISALKTSIDTLNSKMIYNYMDENMPEWARPTVQKMMDKGFLKGDENGKLGLTDELLRVFVTNDRAGVYDGC